MAGARRHNNRPNRPGPSGGRPNQAPNRQGDNGYGAARGEKGYGSDATYKMMGGQLTVGNKSGARSWLGTPTWGADELKNGQTNTFGGEGVLAPMGMAKNGFMQHGYVPGARQEGEAGFNVSPSGRGAGYAMEGMDRAGRATNAGWDPKGQANTQAWRGIQSAITGKASTGPHKEFGQRRPQPGGNTPGGMPKKPGMGINPPNAGPKPGGGMAGGFGNKPGGGGRRRNNNGKKPGGLPNLPPPQAGAGMVGGVGEFPKYPEQQDDFLPMTPGYEQDWRGLNDQLGAAESEFAQGQAMLPAVYNLANTRLQNDQTVATDRLNEDLAARGVYTAKNAAGGYGGTSPSGGGVGETMYGRNVATPFGRQFQDLAADQANAYQNLYGTYAGANLGYNQGINEALLNRANEAYELDPMGLANSGYSVPDMANPYFPFAPQNRPGGGGKKKKNNKKNNKNVKKPGGRR